MKACASVLSELFDSFSLFGMYGTTLGGVLEPIHFVHIQLSCLLWKFEKCVLSSDSQAAFNSSVLFIKKYLSVSKIANNNYEITHKRVVSQWIPGHCNLHGKDQADVLPEKAL